MLYLRIKNLPPGTVPTEVNSEVLFMDKDRYYEPLKEINKLIVKRIVDTGKMEESDVLFLAFFKQNFEQNTKIEE